MRFILIKLTKPTIDSDTNDENKVSEQVSFENSFTPSKKNITFKNTM